MKFTHDRVVAQRSPTFSFFSLLALAAGLALAGVASAQSQGPGNLLRNGNFQDDWLTMLPELKNHHWNYTTEVYNRRDYNPDAWRITGKWEWRDADKMPYGLLNADVDVMEHFPSVLTPPQMTLAFCDLSLSALPLIFRFSPCTVFSVFPAMSLGVIWPATTW